jgi:hypothetical protein
MNNNSVSSNVSDHFRRHCVVTQPIVGSGVIEPLSKLSLLLAIKRARDVGFDSFAAALVKTYAQLYPETVRTFNASNK